MSFTFQPSSFSTVTVQKVRCFFFFRSSTISHLILADWLAEGESGQMSILNVESELSKVHKQFSPPDFTELLFRSSDNNTDDL